VAKEVAVTRLTMAVAIILSWATAAVAADSQKDTKDFADSVASATQFEIQSSQLAQKHAKAPELKSFADQMIADHTKAADEFKTALREDGIAAPSDTMGITDLANYERLHLTTSNSFDGAYAKAQLNAHEKAVGLFRGYAQSGSSPKLKAFAEKTLPILEHHLEMIKEINRKIGQT